MAPGDSNRGGGDADAGSDATDAGGGTDGGDDEESDPAADGGIAAPADSGGPGGGSVDADADRREDRPADRSNDRTEDRSADRDARAATVRRVGLVVLGVNVALFAAKAAVWWTTGSLAVGSEAANSLADGAYSLVIVGGLYLTTRPPDFDHPHGHERIEPFVSLFVAAGVFLAGGAVLYGAAEAVRSGTTALAPGAGPPAVGVLLAAAAVKYGLYRYCLAAGDRAESPALVATAVDSRNDVLTAGAALAGVLGAAAGYPLFDPLAAVVVAVAVLYGGVEIVRDNLRYLLGRAPPEELRAEIRRRAADHPEVHGVHDVVAHYVGPEVDVSLHVEVEGEMTVVEAHDVETDVMAALRDLPEVDDVFVHVDPRELGEWKAGADDPGDPADPDELGDPDVSADPGDSDEPDDRSDPGEN